MGCELSSGCFLNRFWNLAGILGQTWKQLPHSSQQDPSIR